MTLLIRHFEQVFRFQASLNSFQFAIRIVLGIRRRVVSKCSEASGTNNALGERLWRRFTGRSFSRCESTPHTNEAQASKQPSVPIPAAPPTTTVYTYIRNYCYCLGVCINEVVAAAEGLVEIARFHCTQADVWCSMGCGGSELEHV